MAGDADGGGGGGAAAAPAVVEKKKGKPDFLNPFGGMFDKFKGDAEDEEAPASASNQFVKKSKFIFRCKNICVCDDCDTSTFIF